jgi:hypothetical protein
MSALPSAIRRTLERRRRPDGASEVDIEPRLVWVFGSPRSGSTWLMRMLRGHEAVVAVNEPKIGLLLGPILAETRDVGLDGFHAGNFIQRRLEAGERHQFFADEFRDTWLPDLGELLRRRFLAHAQRYPARVPLSQSYVVIKEPHGSQSADIIMAALPRARLVFLLRDGRDVIDSSLAAVQPGAWVNRWYPGTVALPEDQRLEFLVLQAHKWLWRTEVVQEAYEAHPGPKRLLRYEELLADPARGLRELLDWLELPTTGERLDELVQTHAFDNMPEEERGESGFYRAARPGGWRENLRPAEQDAVMEVLGPKLRELGYED